MSTYCFSICLMLIGTMLILYRVCYNFSQLMRYEMVHWYPKNLLKEYIYRPQISLRSPLLFYSKKKVYVLLQKLTKQAKRIAAFLSIKYSFFLKQETVQKIQQSQAEAAFGCFARFPGTSSSTINLLHQKTIYNKHLLFCYFHKQLL